MQGALDCAETLGFLRRKLAQRADGCFFLRLWCLLAASRDIPRGTDCSEMARTALPDLVTELRKAERIRDARVDRGRRTPYNQITPWTDDERVVLAVLAGLTRPELAVTSLLNEQVKLLRTPDQRLSRLGEFLERIFGAD